MDWKVFFEGDEEVAGYRKISSNFTLTELLVMIAIIMVLAGIGAGAYHVAMKKAARSRTVASLNKIKLALESFKGHYGYYPQKASVGDFGYTLNDSIYNGSEFKLKSFLNLESEFNNGNAENDGGTYYMLDGWKHRIQYRCPGSVNEQAFDLYSKGEDNAPNTGDEIWCEGLKQP